jgi:Ca-activated chloride channel homolog
MHTLAKSTGGLLVDTSRSQNLTAAFRRIAEELWSQYSIGYYPKDLKHEGAFHSVTVKTHRPDLTIRARSGFYDFK